MDTIKLLKTILGNNATKSKRIGDIQGQGGSDGGGQVLADILGTVLGGGGTGAGQQQQPQGGGGAAGAVLGQVLGDILRGNAQKGTPPAELPQVQPVRREVEDQATVLIKAMCNAAKVDGQIDQKEQEAILSRLGDVSQDEANFVRSELAKPLNVSEFCRSVPNGLGPQVYGFSVMTIKLDTLNEAAFLGRLAEGLGIDGDTCNQIHQQVGAPNIYA